MNEKPIVCGYCRLPFLEHPVMQCLYVYEPRLDAKGRIIGYGMKPAPIEKKNNGADQPSS